MSWPDPTQRAQLPATENAAPVPQPGKPEVEDLGTTTIQGVEARGTRTTTTIPAGEIGNDQPIVTTSEHWISRDFGLVVREITDDPRTGKRTRELVSLDRGEPDIAAFQPPDGYDVTVEELHEVSCQPSGALLP